MLGIKDLALWMYGDVRTGDGFWYSHEIGETAGLTEEQLYWVPHQNGLCILWHVGHIAHREQVHFGRFLKGLENTVIPQGYEVFGTEWCSVKTLSRSIDSIDDVFAWARNVREDSRNYIKSLKNEDFSTVPSTSERSLSIGHWLFITSAHTALHIGRIQLLRALIEDRHEEPCW
jgi:hypothetical protein